MIIAGNRYEFIDERWCVNGIIVGSKEWQRKKWGNRPTLIEALPQYYNVRYMEARLNMVLKLKPILAKRVKDIEQAAIVEEVPAIQTTPEPPPSTSEQSQEPINTLPTAPEPEETTEEPLALPEPDSETTEEPLAVPEPGPKLINDPVIIEPLAAPKPGLEFIIDLIAIMWVP